MSHRHKVKIDLHSDSLFSETINERRLRILKQIKAYFGRYELEQLARLRQLQQLENVQQLEKVGRLTTTSKLSLTCKSYNEVDILTPIEETIIYLDPPYKNTGKYQKSIDYDNLLKWIKKSKYKVYVSSYEFDDLECVAEFEHRTTISATANNKVSEKLFYWQGCK